MAYTLNKTYPYFRIVKRRLMKPVSTYIACVLMMFLISSCDNSVVLEDNDLTISGLKGQVKSINQRTYRAVKKRNDWTKGPANQTYSIKNFDPNGFNIDDKQYFINDNSFYGGSTFVYDAENNLIKINRLGGDESMIGYTEITERIGKVRPSKFDTYYVSPEETTKTGSSSMVWVDYLVTETNFYDKDGKLTSKSSTLYNEDRSLNEFTTVRFAENSTMTVKYTYLSEDNHGNWTSALKEIIGFNYQEIVDRSITYYQ
jgi:hypothetical protein